MSEDYKGISWEDTYPDEELRQSTKIHARFFRESEIQLKNEKRREYVLARNSLENLSLQNHSCNLF